MEKEATKASNFLTELLSRQQAASDGQTEVNLSVNSMAREKEEEEQRNERR